jgi:hypothetical protein
MDDCFQRVGYVIKRVIWMDDCFQSVSYVIKRVIWMDDCFQRVSYVIKRVIWIDDCLQGVSCETKLHDILLAQNYTSFGVNISNDCLAGHEASRTIPKLAIAQGSEKVSYNCHSHNLPFYDS